VNYRNRQSAAASEHLRRAGARAEDLRELGLTVPELVDLELNCKTSTGSREASKIVGQRLVS
jgi:hypothetical protein